MMLLQKLEEKKEVKEERKEGRKEGKESLRKEEKRRYGYVRIVTTKHTKSAPYILVKISK